jgi:hypothetical protein
MVLYFNTNGIIKLTVYDVLLLNSYFVNLGYVNSDH